MTSGDADQRRPSNAPELGRLEDGPFVLRTLLGQVPLSGDGSSHDIKINCVEYYDHNLYVGTTASELLHFVQIPPDPSDPTSQPTFILASRLEPPFNEPTDSRPGVQQILLLPKVSKACVLCNWTVTFYSLPELSPVFNSTKVKNCNWVGGVDLNAADEEYDPDDPSTAVTVLLSLNRRIQVVRIGEDARAIKVGHPSVWFAIQADAHVRILMLAVLPYRSGEMPSRASQTLEATPCSMLTKD